MESQPELFDDITGDGNPNIVVLERPESIGNQAQTKAIRFFSFNGGEVEEFRPYIAKLGEVIYFDDFNGDGVLELVLTDSERHFLYSQGGMPISKYVLIFDEGYKYYWPASRMVD